MVPAIKVAPANRARRLARPVACIDDRLNRFSYRFPVPKHSSPLCTERPHVPKSTLDQSRKIEAFELGEFYTLRTLTLGRSRTERDGDVSIHST